MHAGLPVQIEGQLRDYQRTGIAWLSFLRACGLHGVLADDMGLGKTLQTCAVLAGAAAHPHHAHSLGTCSRAQVMTSEQSQVRRMASSVGLCRACKPEPAPVLHVQCRAIHSLRIREEAAAGVHCVQDRVHAWLWSCRWDALHCTALHCTALHCTACHDGAAAAAAQQGQRRQGMHMQLSCLAGLRAIQAPCPARCA